MLNEDIYERVSDLISFMSANYYVEHEFTVRDMAEELKIPLQVVRNDLSEMMQVMPFKENLYIGEDEFAEYTAQEMKSGALDDLVVYFEFMSFTNQQDIFLVPLKKEESSIAGRWFSGHKPFFKSKDSGAQVSEKEKIKIDNIEKAIESGRLISFDYGVNSDENNGSLICSPKEIRLNSQEPEEARLIAANGKIFKISEMEKIQIIKNKNVCEAGTDVDYDWESIWSLPSAGKSRYSKKQHVKLEIKNTTRNLIKKLQADTERRVNKKLFETEKDVYIYEDEVSGFEDFKSWIMSYGSNIKVIEPAWLADEIREDFRKLKRQYETGEFE